MSTHRDIDTSPRSTVIPNAPSGIDGERAVAFVREHFEVRYTLTLREVGEYAHILLPFFAPPPPR